MYFYRQNRFHFHFAHQTLIQMSVVWSWGRLLAFLANRNFPYRMCTMLFSRRFTKIIALFVAHNPYSIYKMLFSKVHVHDSTVSTPIRIQINNADVRCYVVEVAVFSIVKKRMLSLRWMCSGSAARRCIIHMWLVLRLANYQIRRPGSLRRMHLAGMDECSAIKCILIKLETHQSDLVCWVISKVAYKGSSIHIRATSCRRQQFSAGTQAAGSKHQTKRRTIIVCSSVTRCKQIYRDVLVKPHN